MLFGKDKKLSWEKLENNEHSWSLSMSPSSKSENVTILQKNQEQEGNVHDIPIKIKLSSRNRLKNGTNSFDRQIS
jgi:hypothetical protein